jgi:hypothetical protein
MASEVDENVPPGGKKLGGHNLTDQQRRRIAEALMNVSTNGKIAHGALEVVAKQFGRNRSTVSRIWERACKTSLSGKLNVRSLSKNAGRALKYDRVAVVEAI